MPYITENEWTTASISTWINLKNKKLSTKSNKVCILYNSVCINFRTKVLIYGEYIGGKIKTKGMINRKFRTVVISCKKRGRCDQGATKRLLNNVYCQARLYYQAFVSLCVCVCVCLTVKYFHTVFCVPVMYCFITSCRKFSVLKQRFKIFLWLYLLTRLRGRFFCSLRCWLGSLLSLCLARRLAGARNI